jgi:hypothetical protein
MAIFYFKKHNKKRVIDFFPFLRENKKRGCGPEISKKWLATRVFYGTKF